MEVPDPEIPDPEIPSTEDDIQKDQIQKGIEQVAASDLLCFNNIFIISIPIAMLYITSVYRADMKLKGHRNNPYFLYLSDIN